MVSAPSFLFLFCFIIFQPSVFHVLARNSSVIPLCHDNDRSALLRFKASFLIDMLASTSSFAYPKIKYWNHLDCCFWVGITCDEQTGRVIGLDLSSSFLYGSINSRSSLFHLTHLRNLNLADNNFSHTQIPSQFGHFSELISLNLSSCSFYGQIPLSISQIPHLSTLDLSWNNVLRLEDPDFGKFVQNLTILQDLRLSSCDISSAVPKFLANISSIKSLHLINCELSGEFPVQIFYLPNLQSLQISKNYNLEGYLPEFNSTSRLQTLILGNTGFSGKLPASIGNLASLNSLDLSNCGFSGDLPDSLGKAVELVLLNLASNDFNVKNSSSLSWIGKFYKLNFLSLSGITFNSKFPTFLANLTKLTTFSLVQCQINNQKPSWFLNMTHLMSLSIVASQLQGPIADSVYQLRNLQLLILSGNSMTGTVDLATILRKLRNLKYLGLSGNRFSILDNVDSNSNTTTGKLLTLILRSCNLTNFPHFLKHQDKLQWLDWSENSIHGQIPKWLWNSTKDFLEIVELSSNFLTGFEQDPYVLIWNRVIFLDLNYNMLQGSLPIPPSTIEAYSVAENQLTGEIPPSICSLTSLQDLDVSDNDFTGLLPDCLGNLSTSMEFLDIEGNNFHGKLPLLYNSENCNLKMLNALSNEFEGEIPRSLAKCTKLEFLVLGVNKFNDVFPSWLGALKELKVLILRSNQLHGALEKYINNADFPKLRIIDISHNNFTGKLPTPFFLYRNAMKMVEGNESVYMEAISWMKPKYSPLWVELEYLYSMNLTNKGTYLQYWKVLESFEAIDFSSNKFEGMIPEEIGHLIGLRLLNLSNNNLIGVIPGSLGNLTRLEALDLSENNLLGEIPQQFVQLGFLEFFNVSSNHLTGPIPSGKQFDTFDADSYQNNIDLCGKPLSRKCENSKGLSPSPPSIGEDEESGSFFEFGWKVVALGYGCGLIVGILVGHIVVTKKIGWFLKTFRIKH